MTRCRKEERMRLVERLNSYDEGAPYGPKGEESERELQRQHETERSRRPERGSAGDASSFRSLRYPGPADFACPKGTEKPPAT